MEETNNKPHVQKGLYVAAAMIITDIVLFILNKKITNNFFLNEATPLIVFAGALIAILQEKKALINKQWSAKMGYGFKVTAVAVAIFFVYTSLAVYIVFPNFLNDLFIAKIAEVKQLQGFDANQAAANEAMAKKVLGVTYMSSTVLRHLAAGLAGSVIGAIIKR